MDEEDGRPGPRARKFGPSDVLTDAHVGSLCRILPTHSTRFWQFRAKSSAVVSSDHHPITNQASPRLDSGANLRKAFAGRR